MEESIDAPGARKRRWLLPGVLVLTAIGVTAAVLSTRGGESRDADVGASKPVSRDTDEDTAIEDTAIAPKARDTTPLSHLTLDEMQRLLDIAFVEFEGGEFTMGSPKSEDDRGLEEVAHRVRLSAFALMDTEITQKQWRAVMGKNPSHCFSAGCAEDLPVQTITWFDAIAFTNRLSEITDRQPCYREEDGKWQWVRGCDGYRLPTEAEWEYACRAGSAEAYGLGVDVNSLRDHAWYPPWRADQGPMPVKRKRPNASKLYDIQGNVAEWTWDRYNDYETSMILDPGGASEGSTRVVRGGSIISFEGMLRCAARDQVFPSSKAAGLGFRVARGTPGT